MGISLSSRFCMSQHRFNLFLWFLCLRFLPFAAMPSDASRCKRPSFGLQKVAFYNAKGGLLQPDLRPFARPLATCWQSVGWRWLCRRVPVVCGVGGFGLADVRRAVRVLCFFHDKHGAKRRLVFIFAYLCSQKVQRRRLCATGTISLFVRPRRCTAWCSRWPSRPS